jgi:molybdenum cofactor guanylyltransferase
VRLAEDVEGFVLAGGKSSRMGQDKALIRFNGEPLISRALKQLKSVANTVRIAGNRDDLERFAPALPDRWKDCGPLAGIHASLSASSSDWNIFLPVDMPLLPPSFLQWMLNRVRQTGALATLPTIAGIPQPLVAVYHRALLPGLEASLKSGARKTINVIFTVAERAGGRSQPVDIFSVERVSASGQFLNIETGLPVYQWFRNMNTPQDIESCDSAQE